MELVHRFSSIILIRTRQNFAGLLAYPKGTSFGRKTRNFNAVIIKICRKDMCYSLLIQLLIPLVKAKRILQFLLYQIIRHFSIEKIKLKQNICINITNKVLV